MRVHHLLADAYISTGEDGTAGDDYWHDGDPINVEVSREEGAPMQKCIRIGLLREIGATEDVGIYMNEPTARDLMVALGDLIAGEE